MSIRSTFRRKDTSQSKPKRKASKKNIPGRLFAFVLFLFVLYVGVGYFVSIPAFEIDIISLSGNNVLVASDITPLVEQELEGYWAWPYENNSIFFVQKKDIKESLYHRFGRIENISFKKRGLKEFEIVIEEKDGQYMWCGDVEDLGGHGDCYILDARGSLFDLAPSVSGDAYFKIFGGEVDSQNPIGSEIFSLEDFNSIIFIKEELAHHGLSPVALLLYKDGLIEFVKKTEGKNLYSGPRIKFTLLADYREAIDNLLSALTSEPLQTEFAEKEELLQYIDVRFSNRVYYKFK